MGSRYLSDLLGTYKDTFKIGVTANLVSGSQTYNYGAADTANFILNLRKSRGTIASPAAITSGDGLGKVSAFGYAGGTGLYVEAAAIKFTNVGTVSNTTTGVGAKIEFQVRETGGSLSTKATLSEKGALQAIVLQQTVQTPSFSATPTWDVSLGSVIKVTLTGNITAANFTGGVDGQAITLALTQDGTGTRTIAWGSSVAFGTDITATTLTTTINKTDYIGLIYDSTSAKYRVVAFTKGF